MADVDIRHAVQHAIRVHVLDGYLIVVGPARDGALLEIGCSPTRDRILHAMKARPKYLRGG